MDDAAEWFQKIRKGDWQAFSACFNAYAEQLLLYAAGFVGNREDARDIVQDAFLYLWANRETIRTDSLYGYLIRSVKNSCIDFKLHEKVKERYSREVIAMQNEAEEESVDMEQLYERLRVVVDALPPKCREIFVLGCVEGVGYKEIADRLGVSVNTVKTQIKVAYKKIKSELSDQDKSYMLMMFPVLASLMQE